MSKAETSTMDRLRKARSLFIRHLRFVGPGLVSAVAYIDPGNWATDLQGGALYGYKLLFVVLLAGLAAVVLQLLAVRLGATTSQSLAVETRLLFLRWESRYPKWRRWFRGGLYFLYALAEIAIVATDLAELLGSAIALNLLFPKLPLFAGVLITASDVLLVLLFFRSDSGRQGMLFFEIVIVSLVLCVFVSFMVLLHLVQPDWKEVFLGLVPSKTLVKPGALYVGVGIIGATVMPHALFLGSSLASVDRLDILPRKPSQTKTKRSYKLPSLLRRRRSASAENETELGEMPTSSNTDSHQNQLEITQTISTEAKDVEYELAMKQYDQDVRKFDRINWVDIHLFHSAIDTALSLLCFALTINASILTVAGSAFYYHKEGDPNDADLNGAHALIRTVLGNGPAIIFALALLCAGQSASITCTLAGQVVSEGFLQWKTSPIIRRAVTRLLGVIPAAIVAAAVGNSGLDTMLVASQVLLSIVLPTVILPLVYICSRQDTMTVLGPIEEEQQPTNSLSANEPYHVGGAVSESATSVLANASDIYPINQLASSSVSTFGRDGDDKNLQQMDLDVFGQQHIPVDEHHHHTPHAQGSSSMVQIPSHALDDNRRKKSYVSPKWVTWLGYLLFFVVVLANGYVIVELILGNTGP